MDRPPGPLLPRFQQPGGPSRPLAVPRPAAETVTVESQRCQFPNCDTSVTPRPHQDARYCSPQHRRAARSLRRQKQITERRPDRTSPGAAVDIQTSTSA